VCSSDLESQLAEGDGSYPRVDVEPDDTAVIIYTGGTTGRPKGVVRTHESHISHYLLSNINMGVRPTDKVMLVMPMCHVNSIQYSFPYTLMTAPVFVYNMVSFDPEDLLTTIDRYQITYTSLVPTHYRMILDLPEEIRKNRDVSSIRQLLISSAPATKDLKLAIMDYFKNAELWEAYGSTEGGLGTLLRPEEQFKKLGSIGKGLPSTRLEVLKENGSPVAPGTDELGEIVASGDNVTKGYWQDAVETENFFRDGKLRTGDMGKIDDDGYIFIVGRKSELLLVHGMNVYPREIEEVLSRHPGVEEGVVIGVPHPKWGESIRAIVVTKKDARLNQADIIDHCRRHLASHKKPTSVIFVEELPKGTFGGKVLKRVLRDKYAKG